jgi:hypothetical protein
LVFIKWLEDAGVKKNYNKNRPADEKLVENLARI